MHLIRCIPRQTSFVKCPLVLSLNSQSPLVIDTETKTHGVSSQLYSLETNRNAKPNLKGTNTNPSVKYGLHKLKINGTLRDFYHN